MVTTKPIVYGDWSVLINDFDMTNRELIKATKEKLISSVKEKVEADGLNVKDGVREITIREKGNVISVGVKVTFNGEPQ